MTGVQTCALPIFSLWAAFSRDRCVQGDGLHVRTLCPVILLEYSLACACRRRGYGDLNGLVGALFKLEADLFHLICVFVFKLQPAFTGAVVNCIVVIHCAVCDRLYLSRGQTADVWKFAQGDVLRFFFGRRSGNFGFRNAGNDFYFIKENAIAVAFQIGRASCRERVSVLV